MGRNGSSASPTGVALRMPGTLPEHGRAHDGRLQQRAVFCFFLFFFFLSVPLIALFGKRSHGGVSHEFVLNKRIEKKKTCSSPSVHNVVFA